MFVAVTVIPCRNSSADFYLLSLSKINTFWKKSDPDVLQAYITQSQNPRQYFTVVFCLATVIFCQHIAWQRQFPELSSLIELNYLHLPSNLVINIFTLTKFKVELKVNLERYIFYMHYSVYSKLQAEQIFAYICQHLRSLAQLIVNKLCANDLNISLINKNRQYVHFCSLV